MKKVLYITGNYSTKYGGMEKYIVELLKQGIDLSVVYNDIPSSQEFIEDLHAFNSRLYVVRGNILKRAIYSFKIIMKEKPDIIHYHFGFLVYFLFIFIKICFPKTKQVLTQHCEFIYKGFVVILARICYHALDGVISVSEGVKRGLVSKIGTGKRFIVHYLGVAKKRINNYNLREELGINKDAIVITTIGFDIRVKGFDLLAEAISLLKKENKIHNLKIIVIGLGDMENKELQQIIDDLNVREFFISPGIRNDVDDFLYFSDIYIQPSRTEAISLSIMEALLYGIPIIGTNVGGIPEVCIDGYNGKIIDKEDVHQLADAINILCSNKLMRESYGKNSLKLSERFNQENSVRRLISYYNKL